MKIDFEKCGGLVPAIIQDATTKNVLMLGYMNQEAYENNLSHRNRYLLGGRQRAKSPTLPDRTAGFHQPSS